MWTWNSDPFGTDARTLIRPERGRLPTTYASRARSSMDRPESIKTDSEILIPRLDVMRRATRLDSLAGVTQLMLMSTESLPVSPIR
jgi:hypothetical protein